MMRDGPATLLAPRRVRVAPGRRASWTAAVSCGWAVAAVILAPSVLSAPAGERASPSLILAAVLVWWIAVVMVIRSDLRDFVIPDGASLTIAALGLGTAVAQPWLSGDGLAAAVIGGSGALATGVVGFALFAAVGAFFRRRGRDALGFGDVKLAGASAVWLGPGDAALALEIAAVSAIVVLLVARKAGPLRETAVPFGAFMAPAAWLVFVLGPVARDAAGPWPW